MRIDWNPNIVGRVHSPDHLESFFSSHSWRVQDRRAELAKIQGMADHFVKTLAEARRLVGAKVPLAYRLDLKTEPVSKEMDPFAPMQIGGLPDLFDPISNMASHIVHNGGKPVLRQLVDRYWPRNQVTGEPLKFFGQFDLYDWMLVLHGLTHETWDNEAGTKEHYWVSGAGNYHLFEWPFRLQVFYEPDYCDHLLGSTAAIVVTDLDLFPEKHPFSRAEVNAAIQKKAGEVAKIKRAHSETIQRRRVLPPTLGFDMETGEDGKIPNWRKHDELTEQAPFKQEADITVFGQPSSQQEPKRFINPYPYHPHRLTPFLAWTSQEHDVTYQICAAMKTYHSVGVIEAKVDSSCT